MADNLIKFGTSGWPRIIADTFTFENVRLASVGIARFLLRHYLSGRASERGRPQVVVGYDTRFLSERFAESAADVLNSHGVEARVTSRPHPTPALAYDIIHRKLDGGINITASHNPAEYNGLEFSSADGAPALPEVTHEIEENVGRILEDPSLLEGSNATRLDPSLRQQADPRPAYLDEIRRRVDLKEAEDRL